VRSNQCIQLAQSPLRFGAESVVARREFFKRTIVGSGPWRRSGNPFNSRQRGFNPSDGSG
jgi:hypothetical protein